MLKLERFRAVLRSDVFDSWGFEWEMLKDPKVSFDDPQKSSAMNSLYNNFLNTSLCRYNEDFAIFHGGFLILRSRIALVHAVRLKEPSSKYFQFILQE